MWHYSWYSRSTVCPKWETSWRWNIENKSPTTEIDSGNDECAAWKKLNFSFPSGCVCSKLRFILLNIDWISTVATFSGAPRAHSWFFILHSTHSNVKYVIWKLIVTIIINNISSGGIPNTERFQCAIKSITDSLDSPPKHQQNFSMFSILLLSICLMEKTANSNKENERKKKKLAQAKIIRSYVAMMTRKKTHTAKTNTKGKSWANNFNLQYDISLFESFILLFDINAEMCILEQRWYVCRSYRVRKWQQLERPGWGSQIASKLNKNKRFVDDIIKRYLIWNCYCLQVLVCFLRVFPKRSHSFVRLA